jgi:hypothetical protein
VVDHDASSAMGGALSIGPFEVTRSRLRGRDPMGIASSLGAGNGPVLAARALIQDFLPSFRASARLLDVRCQVTRRTKHG